MRTRPNAHFLPSRKSLRNRRTLGLGSFSEKEVGGRSQDSLLKVPAVGELDLAAWGGRLLPPHPVKVLEEPRGAEETGVKFRIGTKPRCNHNCRP